MKLTPKNTMGKRVVVRDAQGTVIPLVSEFDTKTGKAVIYLDGIIQIKIGSRKVLGRKAIVNKAVNRRGDIRLSPIKLKVTLKGAFAEVNGKIVK